ncbi:TonB-dependent receptor-like superfamily protein [Desulfonema magnum]|uniref:TonB-dependent receptor-like superfamily protein n=1 Tax=Desulfonema magnum TaxID=45655 RepID=A0A975BIN8_9BACT|nr:TonB-dependent receptor-like superfamily protein [Desulfonema magnum]
MLNICIPGALPLICRADDLEPNNESVVDFTEFSLEELKNVEIISVSKKLEKLSEVSAAVYVITQEDIRRSGATNIPDALRLAPGVQVARNGPTEWAVTIRCLNEEFSENLLVLIDGRSVYSPVFSGVHWDVQDTVLEDIERIEVIRGPGAAIWGANAVNGVINIITKSTKDTQDGQFLVLGGTEEESGSIRYGGNLGNDTYYRTYVKYFGRERFSKDNRGGNSDDNWRSVRGGFRIDREPETAMASNSLTLQGEAYANRYDTKIDRFSLTPPYYTRENDTSEAAGGHLLGRWQHTFSETSDTELQLYYDHTKKDYDISSAYIDTVDLDFRHKFNFSQHEIVWGLGYRFITDEFSIKNGHIQDFQIDMEPLKLDQHVYSAFVQDKVQLIPERLNLTIGSKFEYNDYMGFEVQPSIRLLWIPGKQHALWGAISRAVRTPSRIEQGLREIVGIAPSGSFIKESASDTSYSKSPAVFMFLGNDELSSETLMAYEVGYRLEPTNTLRLDMTAFYYNYDKLIMLDFDELYLETAPFPHYIIPYRYKNSMEGEAHGTEVAADWHPLRQWRMKASYSYLKTRLLHNDDLITDDFEGDIEEKSNPGSQFSLRSSLDITDQLELDAWLRYVDTLSEKNVDSYTTLDVRLAWKPMENLELSVVGQNLLDGQHQEFSPFEVERSVYFRLSWRF